MIYDGSASIATGVLSIIKHVIEWWDIVQNIKNINDQFQKGAAYDAVWDSVDAIMDMAKALLSIAETLCKIGSGITKVVGGATGMIEKAATVCGVFGNISGAIGIATSCVDVAKGAYGIVRHSVAAERMDNARDDVKKLADKETDAKKKASIQRNAMLLQRARSAEEKQAIVAAVDTVTGGLKIASGAMVFVPGAGLVGTGLGLLASGASIAAKLIINACFKKKNANEGFAASMGMTMHDYNKLTDQMGHKKAERTHEVMRRTLGISTRDDYSKALSITNAIDLYAGAQAYSLINSNPDQPVDSDQQSLKRTMEGLGYSKPAAYGKIELNDILKTVEAPNDWRGQLRTAISNNTDFNIKEDISLSMAKDIAGGKYDQKPSH